MHLTIIVFCCALGQWRFPRDTDAVGCVFMAPALMRELTVVITFGWLRGLMSIFTESKIEVHNFQSPVYVICKLFKKWCFSCSLFLNGVFGEGRLFVKQGFHATLMVPSCYWKYSDCSQRVPDCRTFLLRSGPFAAISFNPQRSI